MPSQQDVWIEDAWNLVINKINITQQRLGAGFPHASNDGRYDLKPPEYWTAGFWPGLLWLIYRETNDTRLRTIAEQCEERLDEVLQGFYKLDHDIGFMWQLTSVANYTLTNNETSKLRALTAASHLAGRFNVKGQYIRAWNNRSKGWAIIDCMMNIPLLYWASQITEDPRFYHIAKAHAHTTVEHFMHEDGSAHHIVSFDPDEGNINGYEAGQGYATHSAWSRGTAWALYGLALSYKYTKDHTFLDAAQRAAQFFISNLPGDFVPHWDFKVPVNMQTPRDSSAGAIGASGLLELAKYVADGSSSQYVKVAREILHSLCVNYGSWERPGEEGLILGASTNVPVNYNVEVPLIYGDYFYVESLAKLTGYDGLF